MESVKVQDCLYKGINAYFIGGGVSDKFNNWEGCTSTNSRNGSEQYIVSAFRKRGANDAVTVTVYG